MDDLSFGEELSMDYEGWSGDCGYDDEERAVESHFFDEDD